MIYNFYGYILIKIIYNQDNLIYYHFTLINDISKLLILFLILSVTSIIVPFFILYEYHKISTNMTVLKIV